MRVGDDVEIARLAQHVQRELENEINYLLTVRKEHHAAGPRL